MKKKNEVKLYNVLFPVWMLSFIPYTWLIILPGNLIIDFLVLFITMKILKVEDYKGKTKQVIWGTYVCGFISDFIGTVGMYLAVVIDPDSNHDWWYENITNAVSYNPFSSIFGFLWVTACVLISAFAIYMLNYKLCLRKLDIEQSLKKKISLSVAVFTAPYLFYFPSGILY